MTTKSTWWVSLMRFLKLAYLPLASLNDWIQLGLLVIVVAAGTRPALPWSPVEGGLGVLLLLGLVGGYRLQRQKDLAARRLPISVSGLSGRAEAFLQISNSGTETLNLGAQIMALDGTTKTPRKVSWGLDGKRTDGLVRPGETDYVLIGTALDGGTYGKSFYVNSVGSKPYSVDMRSGTVTGVVRVSSSNGYSDIHVSIVRSQAGVSTEVVAG